MVAGQAGEKTEERRTMGEKTDAALASPHDR